MRRMNGGRAAPAGLSRGLRRALALLAAVACLASGAPAAAQSIGRGPNLNIGVGPRISIDPTIRHSPNISYGGYDQPPPSRPRSGRSADTPAKGSGDAPRRPRVAAADASFVPREVLVEFDGTPNEAEVSAIVRRHRLTRLQSQSFALTNSTFFRWRIPDGRSVDAVVRELNAAGQVKSAQRNNIFRLQQAAQAEGDPAQYALGRLRLPEAHALSAGADVTVAVIDTGIDGDHPELAGAIAGSFDALGAREGAHVHGTGIAAVIAAHARLMGAAPAARLLAIRAFGAQGTGAQSNSFVVLRSLDYAVASRAQIVNMSFAGPSDPALARGLAAAAAKGVVLIAASGNAGARSPPLFPAADPNVIAVTALDRDGRLFGSANRGPYVTVAAPGVDIFTAAPGGKYQIASGTSFGAAFVSGIAALMIARNPDVTAADLRAALAATAHDLGPPGRDDAFGAGEADAFAAVSAVATPLTAATDRRPQPR